MANVVEIDTGVHHRFIFELRYDQGELYLDRCGRIARDLSAREGWEMQSADTNGCHFRNEDDNLTFNFTMAKLDLTQSQTEDVQQLMAPGRFATIAADFAEVVLQELEVKSFPRIGFRALTLFATDSLDDASSRIDKMSLYAPCRTLADLGVSSSISHSVVVTRPQHMVRVAAAPFEQQIHLAPSVVAAAKVKSHTYERGQNKVLIQTLKAKKAIEAFPSVGLMIDLDAYSEDVSYPSEVSALEFIKTAASDFCTIRKAILAERTQK